MKGKILLLICLILFIVSIAGISACEDANQTIIDDDTLSVSQSDGEILGSADNGTFTDLQKKLMGREMAK